ncbi:hypothetical protein D3869_26830 (plasmid) [Azospirillum brasilense]|uniref:Uncharacterized protein n=1 Tax=Azospirillum brasilense TaxID=192 RepID=A0A4D8R6C0_AZOBR|nr:hypothetical protein [Azospirillum brasilense]QCO18885.1 hypothetical protein D3869_26830 [Azospirillum brasilense]
MNKERLDKQRRQARALARIAQEERERTLATLAETEDGKRLLDLMSDLGAEPVEAWPDLVAGKPWLLAAPSDFRTTAVRLIDDAYCARLNAAGLDPMDEPLPWEDASPFQQIRWTLAAPLKPTLQPAKVSLKIMLNMTLTGPDDVPVLRATVAALHGALFGTTALTSAMDAQAAGEDEPANKRKRRTKAEIEADNAAAEAAKNTTGQPAAATPEPAPAPTDEDDVLAMLDDTPAEPEAPKNPWDACYSTTYTQDQINKAFRDWAIKAGSAATRAVLNHLKVGKSSEIKPEQFGELMAVLAGKPI